MPSITALEVEMVIDQHDAVAEDTPAENASGPLVGLDASVETELYVGATFGRTLSTRLWRELSTLVDRELTQPQPTTWSSLFAASTIIGPFRARRFERCIEHLVAMQFARRESAGSAGEAAIRPTVRGIAAVRPFCTVPNAPALLDVPSEAGTSGARGVRAAHRPPQGILRALRAGELASRPV